MTRWVVVGGGTAGCVVAARLSDEAGNDVTLLEAGRAESARIGSASSLTDLAAPGSTWHGLTVRDVDRTSRAYLQGRGLGGSSRINGAVLGGSVTSLPSETVGDDELGPIDRALLASAADAERVVLARRRRRLLSTVELFLTPVRDRQNLHVVTDTTVLRVALDGNRAVGVVLADGARVDADRVALCAGAIFTPAILMRSGVSPPRLGDLLDHAGRVIDLVLRAGVEVDSESLVTGAVLRRDGAEVVAMNHVGPAAPRRAALLVGWLGSPMRGRVTLASDDRDGLPAVTFDALDRRVADGLAGGVQLAESLLRSEPFRSVVADFTVSPNLSGYFHAAGSCAGVVDQVGAVNGYANLYLADASVLELPPSGLYGPTVATALRLASSCLEGRS